VGRPGQQLRGGPLIGDVGRNAAKLGFALITVFFLYRDGERVLEQVVVVLRRFLGERLDPYLAAVGGMTKAVVWGPDRRPRSARASSPDSATGGPVCRRRC
jgi:hypothetical protein